MTWWGIDLGVRSFHAAGISQDGSLDLVTYTHPMVGRVTDQPPTQRAHELASLELAVTPLVMPGDLVHIEEPPYVGNHRTHLKLSQTSAAIAVGTARGGAEVSFVEVDTWKKGTYGRGGASKELVAGWLRLTWPDYYWHISDQHGADQNFIDATCIAIRAAGPRRLGAARRG